MTEEVEKELNDVVNDAKVIDETLLKSRILALMSQSEAKAVEVISSKLKTKSRTKTQSVIELNKALSDAYISANYGKLCEFMLASINNLTHDNILDIGFEEAFAEDLRRLIKTVYDMGFSKGVEISQDPALLDLYLKNAGRIANGE